MCRLLDFESSAMVGCPVLILVVLKYTCTGTHVVLMACTWYMYVASVSVTALWIWFKRLQWLNWLGEMPRMIAHAFFIIDEFVFEYCPSFTKMCAVERIYWRQACVVHVNIEWNSCVHAYMYDAVACTCMRGTLQWHFYAMMCSYRLLCIALQWHV